MQVINFQQFSALPKKTVLSVGGFDGIHPGHLKILQSLKQKARQKKAASCLIVLDPLPFQFVRGLPQKRLFTIEETCSFLNPIGPDFLCLVPFDKTFAGLGPKEFVEGFLVRRFAPLAMLVGYDFRFGKNRTGDFTLLKTLTPFELERVEAVCCEGQPISSSRIRDALRRADMAEVRRLLGRAFSVSGQTLKGEGRGRKLGFPTANLRPAAGKELPPFGVYAGRVGLKGLTQDATPALAKKTARGAGFQEADVPTPVPSEETTRQNGRIWPAKAVINIGRRPSFPVVGQKPALVEAHLLSQSVDLYNKELCIKLDAFIREEKKFSGPTELKTAVRRDIEKAQSLFRHY